MAHDRITQLRIAGLRCIDDLTLDLDGLTVLIGDNGSGKSTIVEALELLRLAARPLSFVNDVLQKRGGLGPMLWDPARPLRLGVTVAADERKLSYDLEVAQLEHAAAVVAEEVRVDAGSQSVTPSQVLTRTGGAARFASEGKPGSAGAPIAVSETVEFYPGDHNLAITQLGVSAPPAVTRILEALSRIDVQPPFETRPRWQLNELGARVRPRDSIAVESARTLERYGANLANCFHTLRNDGNGGWERVLARVRLGLGFEFRDFQFPAVSRGTIELALLFSHAPDRPVLLERLSEGQFAFLCFVALVELSRTSALLAVEEPELHLHPALLARVVYMLEELARDVPVLVSTHSDSLLDALEDAVRAVVLCERDQGGATRLRRVDQKEFEDWRRDYRGLGELRAAGFAPYVFAPAEDGKAEVGP